MIEPEKSRQHYEQSHGSHKLEKPQRLDTKSHYGSPHDLYHYEQSHNSYEPESQRQQYEQSNNYESQNSKKHNRRYKQKEEDGDSNHEDDLNHKDDSDHEEHTSLEKQDMSYGENDWVGDGWCRPTVFCDKCSAEGNCCRRFCLRVLYDAEYERQSCDEKYCERRQSSDLCRKCRQCECTSGKYGSY